MPLKVVVRVAPPDVRSGGSCMSDSISNAPNDSKTLELPVRPGACGQAELLHFDRVYAGDVPVSTVFGDGIWSLVQLALAGDCSSTIVMPAGASTIGQTRYPSVSGGSKEDELGLAVALVWLTLRTLLMAQETASCAANDAVAAVFMSWLRIQGNGPPADALREFCPVGLRKHFAVPNASQDFSQKSRHDVLIKAKGPCSRTDASGSCEGAAEVAGLTEVQCSLSLSESLFEMFRTAARDKNAQGEHNLLTVAVESKLPHANSRGQLRVFSLAGGVPGSFEPSHAALQPVLEAMELLTAPATSSATPPVQHLLASCFVPPHRTLLVICVPQSWREEEDVLSALRFGARLRAAGARLAATNGSSTHFTNFLCSRTPIHSSLRESGSSLKTFSDEGKCMRQSKFERSYSSSSLGLSPLGLDPIRLNVFRHAGDRPTPSTASTSPRSDGSKRGLSRRLTIDPAWCPRGYGKRGSRCHVGFTRASTEVRAGLAAQLAELADDFQQMHSTYHHQCTAEEQLCARVQLGDEQKAELQRIIETQAGTLCAEEHSLCILETKCARLHEEVLANQQRCEVCEDKRFALRAKDRAIMELQVWACEARRREAQLAEELSAAEQRLSSLEGIAGSRTKHEALCLKQSAELKGEHAAGAALSALQWPDAGKHKLLKTRVGIPLNAKSASSDNHSNSLMEPIVPNSSSPSWQRVHHTSFWSPPLVNGLAAAVDSSGQVINACNSNVQARALPSRQQSPPNDAFRNSLLWDSRGFHPVQLEVPTEMPLTSHAEIAQSCGAAIWPWEVVELHSFLESRYGSLACAVRNIFGNGGALGFGALVARLQSVGYVEDRDALCRLWAHLDCDGDGLVSETDLVRLRDHAA